MLCSVQVYTGSSIVFAVKCNFLIWTWALTPSRLKITVTAPNHHLAGFNYLNVIRRHVFGTFKLIAELGWRANSCKLNVVFSSLIRSRYSKIQRERSDVIRLNILMLKHYILLSMGCLWQYNSESHDSRRPFTCYLDTFICASVSMTRTFESNTSLLYICTTQRQSVISVVTLLRSGLCFWNQASPTAPTFPGLPAPFQAPRIRLITSSTPFPCLTLVKICFWTNQRDTKYESK